MIRPRALLLALLLCAGPVLADVAPIAPTSCGPGDAGTTCDGSGPASQGNISETNQGAGNPINVITGNKYQRETDLPALPGVLGLEIVRHYNSALAGAAPGMLGRGWRLSYETDVYPVGNTLQVMQADGTRIIFIRDPNNSSQCATNDPARGRLSIVKTPRGEEYVWTWTSGRVLSFNHQGRLTQIKAPTGEFVSLTRDPSGLLVKVTDPQGRSLVFGYPKRSAARFNGVAFVSSPAGRFAYSYGSAVPTGYASGSAGPNGFSGAVPTINPRDLLANLAGVTLPDQVVRRYRYEDARFVHHLTGLTVESRDAAGKRVAQRVSTWAYDMNGRGTLSVKGWPKRLDKSGRPVPGMGVEQVNLVFASGRTTLTNSLGRTTVYTHAIVGNEHRLLEVWGAGCASCGEANVRYGYDGLGRLTTETKLSPDGRPLAATKTGRDALGRPVRMSAVLYSNGKPLPAKGLARYEYAGDSNRPVLIARPSVIPGKEAITRIAYNDKGQPLSVTETGFSPAVLPSATGSEGQATPISRTTTYAYRTINNRSLLSAIDGPLANGPKNDPADSDVTRIEWDGRGNAVAMMTLPGGLSSTMHYDDAGRIARVDNADGFGTRFTYATQGQVTRVASSGANWAKLGIKPVAQSFKYDALGNQVETGKGGVDGLPYRPQSLQAFDAAGRLLWQAEALGILKRASYDTEGKLLSSTVQTRSFGQTERYRYDEFNRLVQVADTTGVVRNVDYAKTVVPRPRAASALNILKDDFGRVIKVASASHGTLIKSHDAADRLVEQRSDKGDAQTYAYDLTGRRIRHSVIPKTGETQTTTWRYTRGQLAEVNDPVQTERIRYNERGQPASKTVTLKLANGADAVYITRNTYTADGSLQSESLPDGSKLIYERNGQGQVVAVSRQTSRWTLFGWGNTTLAKELERDLIGLRHVTYGNGIEGQWQRSREGVLARVVYTRTPDQAILPSRVAAASEAAARQPILGSILSKLLPSAYAQTSPTAPGKLPGALGIPADPRALFDARLLYDDAGNVLLQKQQGRGQQHSQFYAYDPQSQLVVAHSASPSPTIKATTASDSRVWRYHYDRNGNRDLAQENMPAAEMGFTRKAVYDPASNALLSPVRNREYVWNAQGQLAAIRRDGQDIARYRYNYRGLRVGKQVGVKTDYALYNDQRQRIADLDANGRITRQYLWLGDHLIATLDAQQPKAPQAPADSIWQELTRTARALWTSLTGNEDRLAFVHVNHLGAPIAATNKQGQAIWQADYAPYGQVIKVGAVRPERVEVHRTAYTLALRLPGQWEDSESGLYYNDFRYYDPQAGRYLSPDPLGPLAEQLGSPNAYSYVNNNPASYIDPWGLILFAFDGTENTTDLAWLAAHNSSLSNVVRFRDLYNDGSARYITGVGVVHKESDPKYSNINAPLLDAGVAWSGPERIERMVDYFNDEANVFTDDSALMDVDIIGFSRGSAEARDFANRINANTHNGQYSYTVTVDGVKQQRCQMINFRFMGLLDTVLSNNWSGTEYVLEIVPGFQYVAQAVALNEFRGHTLPLGRANPLDTHSWGSFPLESIMGGTVPVGQTRIERGFIGAHADIGGGFGPGDDSELAKVALAWIVDQADAAGIKMKTFNETIIANPVIHDKSDAIRFGSPVAGSGFVNDGTWNPGYDIPSGAAAGTGAEDREVRYRDDNGNITTKTTQREMNGTGMTYADTEQFITFDPTRNRPDNVTGTVDMKAYLNWLNANGYNITKLTVQ